MADMSIHEDMLNTITNKNTKGEIPDSWQNFMVGSQLSAMAG